MSVTTIIGNLIDLMTLILDEHSSIESNPKHSYLNLDDDPELRDISESPTVVDQQDDSSIDSEEDDLEKLLVKKGL